SVGSKRNTLRPTGGGTGPSLGKHAMRRGNHRKCGCFPPPARPLQDTLKSKPKPTRTIPSMKPTSQTVKVPICEIHFGVRPLFAFSGARKMDAAPYARRESPASPDGGFTTAFPWSRVARKALRTAFFFTQSAATRFTASIFPFLNRVFPKRAFEGLEPYMAKVLSTVLRGLGPSNGVRLLGR